MSDETVRLTYAELARARGITQAAAKRMALRHRWPKQIGNDGLSRVTVPASALVRIGYDTSDDTSVVLNGDARDGAGGAAPQVPGLPFNGSVLAAIVDTAVAAGDAARADAVADARQAVRVLEEAVASLREQLATERLLRSEDKERTHRAESRVQELQEKLEAEMSEHRQLVRLLTERLTARRLWWPWRRRS